MQCNPSFLSHQGSYPKWKVWLYVSKQKRTEILVHSAASNKHWQEPRSGGLNSKYGFQDLEIKTHLSEISQKTDYMWKAKQEFSFTAEKKNGEEKGNPTTRIHLVAVEEIERPDNWLEKDHCPLLFTLNTLQACKPRSGSENVTLLEKAQYVHTHRYQNTWNIL